MKRQWALIVLIAFVLGVSLPPGNDAAQKRVRPSATSRKPRTVELAGVEQFKNAFQNDAGKVRLVALISPT